MPPLHLPYLGLRFTATITRLSLYRFQYPDSSNLCSAGPYSSSSMTGLSRSVYNIDQYQHLERLLIQFELCLRMFYPGSLRRRQALLNRQNRKRCVADTMKCVLFQAQLKANLCHRLLEQSIQCSALACSGC